MYELRDSEGHTFLTVTGIPVTKGTCLIYMVRYGDVPDGFDLSVIFDYLKADGYGRVLMTGPRDVPVPGWDKVGDFSEGVIWSLDLEASDGV